MTSDVRDGPPGWVQPASAARVVRYPNPVPARRAIPATATPAADTHLSATGWGAGAGSGRRYPSGPGSSPGPESPGPDSPGHSRVRPVRPGTPSFADAR